MFEPSASIASLKHRADVLRQLRAFFLERHIWEADVPQLGRYPVTDIHLECLAVNGQGYLQTSPEFYLKRLLAAGSGSVYWLGKAYRKEEMGQKHRPEFTLLEWYCLGFDDQQLMDQVQALLLALAPQATQRRMAYKDIFTQALGLDPHAANLQELHAVTLKHLDLHTLLDDKSAYLDLLFSHLIEPHLQTITLVYDFPKEQCALAKLGENAQGQIIAKRFEVYWQGLELANGYWELTDQREQLQRFMQDQRLRQERQYPEVDIDPRFMAALKQGLPECAGIALGVDRLMMCLLGQKDIAQVMAFADY